MRGGIEDNSKIIFLLSQQKHYVVTPQSDSSNDGNNICFKEE